jgi:hypothetical protein
MTEPTLFTSAEHERERITAAVAGRFPAYGQGTPENPRNATAASLAGQPAVFAFGVPVRAVVDLVCDLAGVLPLPERRP